MGGLSRWEMDSWGATKDAASDIAEAAKPYIQDAADFWKSAKGAISDPEGRQDEGTDFWQNENQRQTNALRQSVSYGSAQNQDEYAKHLRLGQQMGVSPEVAKQNSEMLTQAADSNRMDYDRFQLAAPRTAQWATNPENAAVAGVDELHRLGVIEQHADIIRALTPKQEFESRYVKPLEKAIYSFAPARFGINVLGDIERIYANVGERFGLHETSLRRAAESLGPGHFGSYEKPEDEAARLVAPIVAFAPVGMAGRVLGAAGMSAEAASVVTGLTTGAGFTAEQSGATYNAMKERGASDEEAWSAANKVAAINAPFQLLFGFTHIPAQWAAESALKEAIASGASREVAEAAVRRASALGGVLPSLGVGGATGGAGQIGQNWITGQPLMQGVPGAIVSGAATQLGMRAGMGFFEQMAGVIAQTDQSKLKKRSPEKFHDAAQNVFAGQEALRIPVEQFETYFQSQNMDPAAVAAGLGVQNYAEAKLGGQEGHVEVATADFLTKLERKHQEGLLPDIVDPASGMTFNQKVKGEKDLAEWAKSGGPEELKAKFEAAEADRTQPHDTRPLLTDEEVGHVQAGFDALKPGDVTAANTMTLEDLTKDHEGWKAKAEGMVKAGVAADNPDLRIAQQMESLYSDLIPRRAKEVKFGESHAEVKAELKRRMMEGGYTESVAETNATLEANVMHYLARQTGMQPREVLDIMNPRIRVGEVPEPAMAQSAPRPGYVDGRPGDWGEGSPYDSGQQVDVLAVQPVHPDDVPKGARLGKNGEFVLEVTRQGDEAKGIRPEVVVGKVSEDAPRQKHQIGGAPGKAETLFQAAKTPKPTFIERIAAILNPPRVAKTPVPEVPEVPEVPPAQAGESLEATAGQENQVGAVIGGRPGEMGWSRENLERQSDLNRRAAALDKTDPKKAAKLRKEAGKLQTAPPPIAGPPPGLRGPDINRLAPKIHEILTSSQMGDLAKDLFNIDGLTVTRIDGSWKGTPEPSWVISGKNMTFEQADGLSRLLGFSYAQDATFVSQPTTEGHPENIPTHYIASNERLTPEQRQAAIAEAKKQGIDYSITQDGKGFKFLYFGKSGTDADTYNDKVEAVRKAAGLPLAGKFTSRSKENATAQFTRVRGDHGTVGAAWLENAAAGPSDLFRRTVDHLVVPYARAVAGEGYHLDADRFAERFGLDDGQREYLREQLNPKLSEDRSSVPIANGTETLDTGGSNRVGDLIFALQNRAAQKGWIEPGDYSHKAQEIIATNLAREIAYHMGQPGGSTAIGWYDRILKRAKAAYAQIFPELVTDPDKEMMFDAMLGITSQNNNVFANSRHTVKLYNLVRNGATIGDAVRQLYGTFGAKTRAIENNLLKYEELSNRLGPDKMRELMNKKMTVSEWNAKLRKDSALHYQGEPLKMEGGKDQKVTGWMVFGPKIGSFINNLHGDYSTLTADLWFSRTWNRILGRGFIHTPDREADTYLHFRRALAAEAGFADGPKLTTKAGKVEDWENGTDVAGKLNEDQLAKLMANPQRMHDLASSLEAEYRKGQYKQKSDLRRAAKNWIELEDAPWEAPRTGGERAFQQGTMEAVQKLVKQQTGQDVSIADLQAVLWYYEKDLYTKFGAADEEAQPADYEDAARQTIDSYNSQTLYQAGEAERPRGGIIVHPDASVEIIKTPRADISTQPHEFMHAYVKVLEILTKREGASDVIKKDYQTLLDFVGAKAGEPLTVPQQEKLARAREQYLREGKAPNPGLRGVFQRFAVWLAGVYKNAPALEELNPEVRDALARMHAGEEGVSRAEEESGPNQFDSPEAAGWTPEQFAKYAESRGMEADKAREEIMSQLNAAALRERTQAWQDEESAVRAAKADEIDARQEYQAIRALRKGEVGQGKETVPLTLNKDELVKQFGEDRVAALQKQHRGIYRLEGGVDAETAAEVLGYKSGEEMMSALESAPARKVAIEQETRQYMTEKHGDIRYDGSLQDKARLAVENQAKSARLHEELKTIERQSDPAYQLREAKRQLAEHVKQEKEAGQQKERVAKRDEKIAALKQKIADMEKAAKEGRQEQRAGRKLARAIPPLEAFRDAARSMIAGKPLVDLNPQHYLDASRKYAREAYNAGLKDDYQAAQEAKQKELMNHFLYREASAAKEESESIRDYAKKFSKASVRERLAKAGGAQGQHVYLDQIDNILASFQFNNQSAESIREAQQKFAAFAAQKQQEAIDEFHALYPEWAAQHPGETPNIGPVVDTGILGINQNYRALNIEQLRAVRDALKNIEALARNEGTILLEGRRVSFAGQVADADQTARANRTSKQVPRSGAKLTKTEEALGLIHGWEAYAQKMEWWINLLDGGDINGPWRRNIKQLIDDAYGESLGMGDEIFGKLDKLFKDRPEKDVTDLEQPTGIQFPYHDRPMTRLQIISWALNMGTEENQKVALIGEGLINPDGSMSPLVDQALSTLRASELKFIQGVWDTLADMAPEVKAKALRTTGIEPKMKIVTPFDVTSSDGQAIHMEGGYYPLKAEPGDRVGMKQNDPANLTAVGYQRPKTSTSHIKTVTGATYKLELDYQSVLSKHLADVINDTTKGEAISQVFKFISDPTVRNAIRETLGPKDADEFLPWLQDFAGNNTGGKNDNPILNGLLSRRTGMVTARLGGNVASTLVQVTDVLKSVIDPDVKTRYIAKAFLDIRRNPKRMIEEIRRLSPNEMRFREKNFNREIRERIIEKGPFEKENSKAIHFLMESFQIMDRFTTYPAWLGRFRQGMAEHGDQARAVKEADRAIARGYQAGDPRNMSRMMRGKGWDKLLTTFGGDGNTWYGLISSSIRSGNYRYAALGIMALIAEQIVGQLIRQRGPSEGESKVGWGTEQALLAPANLFPFWGDLFKAGVSAIEGKQGTITNPTVQSLEQSLTTFRDIHSVYEGTGTKTVMGDLVPDAFDAIGMWKGIPGTAQAVRSWKYLYKVHEGKERPTSTYDLIRNTIFGKVREQHVH